MKEYPDQIQNCYREASGPQQSEKKAKNKDTDMRKLVFRLLYSSPPLIHTETIKSFGAFVGI